MKKILIASIIFICALTVKVYSQSQDQLIEIKDIYEDQKVLEEWNNPGKYSPVNILDNNPSTCFAEGRLDDKASISIIFSSEIFCDEIQVAIGCTNIEELYTKNNRPREVIVWLSSSEEEFNKNKYYKKKVILEDKMMFQKIVFDKAIKFGYFGFQVLDTYRGTKYNDTCINKLKFFNKGKEISVKDVEKLKKDYVRWVGERLKIFFKGGKYKVYSTARIAQSTITKEGAINYYNYAIDYTPGNPPLPTKVFVKDSKLYMNLKGKTGLVNYGLFHDAPMRLLIDFIGDYEYGNGPIFEPIKGNEK